MDDKEFLASLDQGTGEKSGKDAKPRSQERDEIDKLLDGQAPASAKGAAAPETGGEPEPAAEPDVPEPTSVLEMLRQASEAIDQKAAASKAAPTEVPDAGPPASDGAAEAAPSPGPSPGSDPEEYTKAKSWLDGEGTKLAPGASMGTLRQARSTLRGRPGEDESPAESAQPEPAGTAEAAATDDPLARLRQARERLRQTETDKKPEPKRIPAQPRDAIRQLKAQADPAWQPSAKDRKAARKAKRGLARKKATARAAKPRGGRRSDQLIPEGWQGRVAMLIALVLTGAIVQVAVLSRLGVGFGSKDLAAGLCAIFPVFFIMLAVRPAGFRQWSAVVLSCAAIVVIGSAAYAFSVWLGRAGPLAETALAIRLPLVLGLYLLTWGPLFLFVVSVLTRMDLWPDDRVRALVESK